MSLQQMMYAAVLLLTALDCTAQDVTTDGKKAYCNGHVIAEMKTPTRKTGFGLKALRQAIKDAKDGTPKPDYEDGTCYIEDSAGKKVMGFGMYSTQGRYFSSGFGGFVVFRFGDPVLDFTLPAAHIAKYGFYTKKIKAGYDVSGIAPEVLLTFAAMKHLIKPDGTLDTAVVRRTGQWAARLPIMSQQQVNAHEARQSACARQWQATGVMFPLRLETATSDTFPIHEVTIKHYDVYDSLKLMGSVVVFGSWEAWAIDDGEYSYDRIGAIKQARVVPLQYFFYNVDGCEMAAYTEAWLYNIKGHKDRPIADYIKLKRETFENRLAFMTALVNILAKEEKIF